MSLGLTFREVKGTPLTYTEHDENLTKLEDAAEVAQPYANRAAAVSAIVAGIDSSVSRLSWIATDGSILSVRVTTPGGSDPIADMPGCHPVEIRPEVWGAVGDGTEDDTTATIAAVAYAADTGLEAYFSQVYLTTATIPDLHTIHKRGPGSIKVGSTIIPIEPRSGEAITIYADPAGNAVNDGLAATRAVTTVGKAMEIIRAYDAYAQATWTVSLAAGTYTEAVDIAGLYSRETVITIQGPDVSGHPNVPTAIIAAPTTSARGMQLTPGDRYILKDVIFTGFSAGQAINNNGGFLSLVNVHGTGCNRGVINQHGGFTAFTGGIWDGTGGGSGSIGYASYYNATHDSGAAATGEATIFQNFATGLQIGEGTQGHLDYIITQDNSTGVDFKRGCGACNTDNMTIRRNAVGVKAHNAPWYDNQIIWGTGADANTVNVDLRGSAPEQKRQTADHKMKAMRAYGDVEVIPTITLASTGVLEDLFTGPTIPDWAVSEGGDQIEFTACLRLALTGNMALRAYLMQGATVDQFANVTINSAATALYLTVRGSFDTASSFRGYIHAVDNLGTVYAANSDSALNFTNTEGNFLLRISGTATDQITGWTVCYKDTVAG